MTNSTAHANNSIGLNDSSHFGMKAIQQFTDQADLVADFEQRISDFAAGFDQSGGDELSQMAKQFLQSLPAGMFDQIKSIINIVENRKNSITSSDFWETITKGTEDEKERREDLRQSAMNGAGANSRAQKVDQTDYSKTYSNEQLDQMEWHGDMNDVWSIGGTRISRRNAYDAGKKARDEWNHSPAAKAMTPEQRAEADANWSRYLQANKNDDQAAAGRAYDALPPSARASINRQNDRLNLSAQPESVINSRANQSTSVSTGDRSKAFAGIADRESDVTQNDNENISSTAMPIQSVAEAYGFEDAVSAKSPSTRLNLTNDFQVASVRSEQASPQSAQAKPILDQNFGFG